MKPTHDWEAMREHMLAQAVAMTAVIPEDAPKIERAQVRGASIQVDCSIFIRREVADFELSSAMCLRALGLIVGTAVSSAFRSDDLQERQALLGQVAQHFLEGFAVAVNSAVAEPEGGESDVASGEVDLTPFKAQ